MNYRISVRCHGHEHMSTAPRTIESSAHTIMVVSLLYDDANTTRILILEGGVWVRWVGVRRGGGFDGGGG